MSTQPAEEVNGKVKLAREHAILGMYSDSLRYYKGSLGIIQNSLKQGVRDPHIRKSWDLLNSEIRLEVKAVSDIYKAVKALRNETVDPVELVGMGMQAKGGRQEVGLPMNVMGKGVRREEQKAHNEHVPVSIVTPEEKIFIQPNKGGKVPNFQRFGGMPPFMHNHLPDPIQDAQDYGVPSNQVVYIQNNQPPQPPRDPLQWDPPPPKPSRKEPKKRDVPGWANNNKRMNLKPKKALGSGGGPTAAPMSGAGGRKGKVGGEDMLDNKGKRKYDKPWLPTAKEKKEPETFLEFCYPNGDGPDADLINTLERDVVDKCPNVTFDDIAELDEAKRLLTEAVLLPILMPDYFTGIRAPWKGVLMFGPPGTGKTMLAKALATKGQTTFFNVSVSSLASKWRGESEKLVRILFEMARFYGPSTVFFDEMDALFSARGQVGEHEASKKVKAELLTQMDGLNSASNPSGNEGQSEADKKKKLTVVAATNRPWDLDEALIRRLEKRIYIPLPNTVGRKVLFQINLKKVNLDEEVNKNLGFLVQKTEGFSGADVTILCREAAMQPMRRKLKENVDIYALANEKTMLEQPITMTDFIEALQKTHKSVSQSNLADFEKWQKEYGCTDI